MQKRSQRLIHRSGKMLNSKMDFNNLLKVFVRAMLNTDKKYTSLKNATQKPQRPKSTLEL